MKKYNHLGVKGEEEAVKYLIKKGYKIRESNWRFRFLEIDIIAQKENVLVVVEVKTRSGIYFGKPENSVSAKKIKNIVTAANHYIERNDLDMEVRFDILALVKTKNGFTINHIKNAFYYF